MQAEDHDTFSQYYANFPHPKLNEFIPAPPHYIQVRRFARFHPSAPKQLRYSLFSIITQRIFVAGCHLTANQPSAEYQNGQCLKNNFNIPFIRIQVYFHLTAQLVLIILHVSAQGTASVEDISSVLYSLPYVNGEVPLHVIP